MKCGDERGEIMNNNEIAPNIIDNSPGRELIQVIKDQLKKSNGAKFAISLGCTPPNAPLSRNVVYIT